MNSTTQYIDEQITERWDDLTDKWGETLAVQYPELFETMSEITDLQLERERLLGKKLI